MERGSDWEWKVIQREWAARERRRSLANRFVWGVFAVCLGVVVAVVGLAAPPVTYCRVAVDVGLGSCGSLAVGALGRGLILAAGTTLASVGGWWCLSALRADPYAEYGDLSER